MEVNDTKTRLNVELDYLQVFVLIKINGKQAITHRQEVPPPTLKEGEVTCGKRY